MRLHPTWLILAGFASSTLLSGCSSSSSAPAGPEGSAGSGASSGAGAGGASGSGTSGSGGSAGSYAGASGSAGSSAGASGSGATSGTGAGGASGGGASGASGSGATSGAGTAGAAGGTAGAAGSAGAAGMAGMAGTAGASGCAATDQNGKTNWSPGASTSTTQDYLRSCDIRLINNNWGAAAFGCVGSTSNYSVHVNADGSFGWNFQRGNCDTGNTNTKPDFPEVEFGVHPFGAGSSLATTPNFSSTTLLPLQIKDITSASVTVNSLSISLQQSASWDITFELWLSTGDPRQPNPGVYAEFMTFWGWQTPRWPESCGTSMTALCTPGAGQVFLPGDTVQAGKNYKLEVQADNWGSGWRYFQFRDSGGPQTTFNGKVDVKPILNYLVSSRGYSSNLWVTRFEVGSEIDDMTQGSVNMKGITFEVNGQTRTAGSP